MPLRQTRGSVVCPSCGRLVGVGDKQCFSCGRRNPSLWGFGPVLGRLGQDFGFVQVVTGGCVAMYVASLFLAPQQIQLEGIFSFLSPGGEPLLRLGMSGTAPVFGFGRWWTVLSAAWLHGGLLHIALNLYWIRGLAQEVAEILGVSRLVIVYTASSVTGFALTSLMGIFAFLPDFLRGAFYSVGASAPLFGLFGALVYYARRTGRSDIAQHYLQFAVVWVVIGFVMGGGGGIRIDNWAHLGGFGGGYLATKLLDPLRPETGTHGVLALVALALTALSILASFVVPLPPIAGVG